MSLHQSSSRFQQVQLQRFKTRERGVISQTSWSCELLGPAHRSRCCCRCKDIISILKLLIFPIACVLHGLLFYKSVLNFKLFILLCLMHNKGFILFMTIRLLILNRMFLIHYTRRNWQNSKKYV